MTEDDWSVSECDQSGDTDDARYLAFNCTQFDKATEDRDLASSLQSSVCSPIFCLASHINIPSPTKLQMDILVVTLPSFCNIVVNTLESTSFNGF